MTCPSCAKEIGLDAHFCTWCSVFVPNPKAGKKAPLFARWVALMIDLLIALLLWAVATVVLGAISRDLGLLTAFLFPVLYLIWFLSLLRQGVTPGKKLLGLQVVSAQTGATPGFGAMFLREIVGRFLSGLFLGIGYLWALFDKNGQAWHDLLAGTVVVKTPAAK